MLKANAVNGWISCLCNSKFDNIKYHLKLFVFKIINLIFVIGGGDKKKNRTIGKNISIKIILRLIFIHLFNIIFIIIWRHYTLSF